MILGFFLTIATLAVIGIYVAGAARVVQKFEARPDRK